MDQGTPGESTGGAAISSPSPVSVEDSFGDCASEDEPFFDALAGESFADELSGAARLDYFSSPQPNSFVIPPLTCNT